jgi:hypothetical protein
MQPFNHNYFLGYVNEVSPQSVRIHYPSAKLLSKFHHNGVNYTGGNVGNFIIIEGEEYGFLARIFEVILPDSERKSLNEKVIQHDETDFHPAGRAEILLSFSVYEPEKIQKTVSKYPEIGAKVFACSDEQIQLYIQEFGKKNGIDNVFAQIGKLTANDAICNISLDALFGRHCAVVGTTGGGKSWTVSRLIESIVNNSDNKVILIDATGEYSTLNSETYTLGVDTFFPYQNLTIPDLFFLLRPTGQSQRPILLEAIRSLKIVKSAVEAGVNNIGAAGLMVKSGQLKQPFIQFYQNNIKRIEDGGCDFDITQLAQQIRNECVYPTGYNDISKWGGDDNKTFDYQTTIVSRITDLINSDIFDSILGFSGANGKNSIVEKMNNFLSNRSVGSQQVLRISFDKVPASFSAKEIVANSISSYLLTKARKHEFKSLPVVLILDEAHQFLNKNVKDEFFESQTLEAFDLIAKECRKYGLFLCLSTQMPRDIPVGTLSQMGTFIVHRLINEQDKKAIESACSAANRNALSFLPILGEGEALVVGVDFPMPLTLKISEPTKKPESNTPYFTAKRS